MRSSDYAIIFSLILLAIFIWLRQIAWISSADDTLPILVALPLFFWLGMPWKINPERPPLDVRGLVYTVICFLLGVLFNLTILLSAGWTLLLWTWLKSLIIPSSHPAIKKLLVLTLLAFPWITLDANHIGWWFRLSGAWTTAQVFAIAGYDVQQEGTNLTIHHLPISVEVACAGLNTLQSMLIAGSAADFILLGHTPRYWWNLLLLPAMAWLSNTLRIIVLSIAALAVSPEFAVGAFHQWGGWAVVMAMFLFCWLIFALQASQPKKEAPKT